MPASTSAHQADCIAEIRKNQAPARTGYCAITDLPVVRDVVKNASTSKVEAAVRILFEHLKLTRRQSEVLHWMAEGKSNAEIAVILDCSFFTVKNHTKEIYLRLGVHSRAAATGSAYRAHIAAMDLS